MADVVVTVPMDRWEEWLDEGDLPGEPWNGAEYHFDGYGAVPQITRGERVYVVAFGLLRGYAPLVRIETDHPFSRGPFALVRRGRAVAVTIDRPIRGFRGWRYRDWDYADERPFPDWRTRNVRDVDPRD